MEGSKLSTLSAGRSSSISVLSHRTSTAAFAPTPTSGELLLAVANITGATIAGPSSRISPLLALIPQSLQQVHSFLYRVIIFTCLTLPTWLFTLFSTSLTVTLNFTTLLLIALAFASVVSWMVRHRYLNMYTRLPPEPQQKESAIDLFPEVHEDGNSKRGLTNYLDEFLSAIKVFGYLERPVFHELTRTMQTRKLVAGETLLLEEEQGFCLVVDGLVQIFVKSNRDDPGSDPDSDDLADDSGIEPSGAHQGYQLLTEVKNGAPMSSLFSILSLFTEDVKLRHDDDGEENAELRSAGTGRRHSKLLSMTELGGPASELGIHVNRSSSPESTRARRRALSTVSSPGRTNPMSHVPPLSLDGGYGHPIEHTEKSKSHRTQVKRRKTNSAHPDIVARATVDTTIAIIPALAFRRLTRVYPRASAHIVQVILTRLQRVTLRTAHEYLGLTSEVLRIEKLINKYTTYDLPGFLRGAALERLKEKFSKERERIASEESIKGIALHNPRIHKKRRSSVGLRKEAAAQARRLSTRRYSNHVNDGAPLMATTSSGNEESLVNAGDLLANVTGQRWIGHQARASFSQPFQTTSRGGSIHSAYQGAQPHFATSAQTSPPPLKRQESLDEDSFFRESIIDCMLKAIGLTDTQHPSRQSASVEQSPRLVSYDFKRQKAVFNNAFGFMDPIDTSVEGDSESVASIPSSLVNVSGSSNIRDELIDDVEIVFFPKGTILVEQGERNPGLYYVIDGFVDVSVPAEESASVASLTSTSPLNDRIGDEKQSGTGNISIASTLAKHNRDLKRSHKSRSLYLTKPGGLAGYLGTISSRRSFVDVTAKTDVYVGFLPRASIEKIVEKYPIVLLTMAKRLTSLLPSLILHIDFALEWVQYDAGQAIYDQGDESDAIYIVLNGRLRTLQKGADGNIRVVGEHGQGDSVGELEVLTESTRPGTLHAIRDTELVKLPKSLFNSLALENPDITIQISKIIATRMRNLTENPMFEHGRESVTKTASSLVSSTSNLRTISILPVRAGVPVVEFASRLLNALTQIGTSNGVTLLNHATILNHLGRHAFNRMGKLKLSQHLADLEEKFGLVLYVADTNVNSPWTQTCISQADCILMVGLAEGLPSVGEYERLLLTTKTTARKELVLLHAERYCTPGLTRKWLRNRLWINGSHHHIHMSFHNTEEPVHSSPRRFGSALKQRVQVIQAEIQKYTSRKDRQTPLYSAETPFKSDFHRLSRRITGKSVGLVLGGGGARGIAHIGVIRALEEAGIPVDMVGGTSIGAFVGALYAWDADVVPMYGRAKKFAGRMGSMWRFALDLTYPSASYTTGHEFNRGIFKTFGKAEIEDFWLEFYCNTTNISKSRQEIHTTGYVWRYVRASMTLAGLVPPLCEDGMLLLDGGYLDNLTVGHMKSLGADIVFAIDVGSIDDQTPHHFGDSLSGFWATFNRWNPFSTVSNPPTLSEIQARLAYVSSVDALERAKAVPGCRYMRPPVSHYGTLDFGKFEEIYAVGYQYGKEFLKDLRDKGALLGMEETEEKRNLRRTMAPRRASI